MLARWQVIENFIRNQGERHWRRGAELEFYQGQTLFYLLDERAACSHRRVQALDAHAGECVERLEFVTETADILPLDLKISDKAFAFLKLQRGALWDMAGDREAWQVLYEESLRADYESMRRWLPPAVDYMIDVGSGLGGIDIILSRHYRARCHAGRVCLLDGFEDRPAVRVHRETFNDMSVAKQFFVDNGMQAPDAIAATLAEQFPDRTAGIQGSVAGMIKGRAQLNFDLVISLQAWCFHLPAKQYLPFVKAAAAPGATIIVDVRRGRDDCFVDLRKHFSEVGVAHEGKKFRRMVYRNDRPQ